jgi:hypothetical protein
MSIYPFNRYDEAVAWINQARDGNRIISLDISSESSG